MTAHNSKPERNAEIRRLLDFGINQSAIGRQLGISRQRVSQILQRGHKQMHGFEPKRIPNPWSEKRDEQIAELRLQGHDQANISAITGAGVHVVRRVIKERGLPKGFCRNCRAPIETPRGLCADHKRAKKKALADRKRQRYYQAKAAGKCIYCHKPLDREGVRCIACNRKANRDNARSDKTGQQA